MDIGNRIKTLRESKEISQEKLANMLSYKSKTSIFKIEQGITDLPLSKVFEIAEVLKVTPSYLMGWEEYEKKAVQEIDEIELIESIIKKLGYEIVEKTDLTGISSNEIKTEHIANKKAEEFDNNPNSLMFEVTDSNNNTFLISKSDFERLKNKVNYDIKEELENIRKYGVLNQD